MWTVEQLKQMVQEEEGKSSTLPPGLLTAIADWETRGKWNTDATSPKGAHGLFQFMPKTAKSYGVNSADPQSSAAGARKMLEDLWRQQGGDLDKVVASYNWGSGNLKQHGLDKAPRETREYIAAIRSRIGEKPVLVASAQQATPGPVADSTQSFMASAKEPIENAVNMAQGFGRDLVATVNSFLGRTQQPQGASLGTTEDDVRRQMQPRASIDDVRNMLDGMGAIEKPQAPKRPQAPTKKNIKQRIAEHHDSAEQLLGTVNAMYGLGSLTDEKNPLGDLNSVSKTEYMAQLAKMLADFKASPEGFDQA